MARDEDHPFCAVTQPGNRFRFCILPRGHEGEHRNDAATWPQGVAVEVEVVKAKARDAWKLLTTMEGRLRAVIGEVEKCEAIPKAGALRLLRYALTGEKDEHFCMIPDGPLERYEREHG